MNVAANRISDAWIASISLNTSEVFRGQNVDGQVEVRYQAIAPPTALTVQGSSVCLRNLSASAAKRSRWKADWEIHWIAAVFDSDLSAAGRG